MILKTAKTAEFVQEWCNDLTISCTDYYCQYDVKVWGAGIRRLMRGMATLPQGNQELSVVRDKVGRLLGELGVSKSMECDIFPSVL